MEDLENALMSGADRYGQLMKWQIKTPNFLYNDQYQLIARVPTEVMLPFIKDRDTTVVIPKPLRDPESFSKIKASKQIKVTDYQRGFTRTIHSQVVLERSVTDKIRRHHIGLYQGIQYNDAKQGSVTANYSLKTDLAGINHMYPKLHDATRNLDREIEIAVNSCLSSVVSELNSTYDLLTEVAEFRSTAELLVGYLKKIRHPLKSFKDAKRVLEKSKLPEKELHDAVTSLWMQYRYGIMPIVYSVQDCISLLDKLTLFRTARSKEVISGYPLDVPNGDMSCLVDELIGTITVRATGKGRIDAGQGARLMEQIKVNPITTAWELVPYSFVVDWFLNIGDWLDAQFGSLFTFFNEKKFTVSIKSSYARSIYYREVYDSRGSLPSYQGVFDSPSQLYFSAPLPELTWGSERRSIHLVRTEIVNTYIRKVVQPSDVRLAFNPEMNWKRWVDAYVLTLGQTKNQLRKLRI